MATTLVPDTRTDRYAIARGLIEVDSLDHEAGLWRELADFLAEPLALHNLMAEAVKRGAAALAATSAAWVPAVPPRRDAALDTLGARVRASIEPTPDAKPAESAPPVPVPDPEPEHVLADVEPRRGGKYRADRPGWWQRLRDAWADETGDRDEIGAPA